MGLVSAYLRHWVETPKQHIFVRFTRYRMHVRLLLSPIDKLFIPVQQSFSSCLCKVYWRHVRWMGRADQCASIDCARGL